MQPCPAASSGTWAATGTSAATWGGHPAGAPRCWGCSEEPAASGGEGGWLHGGPWTLPGVRDPFVRAGRFPSLCLLMLLTTIVVKGRGGETRRINIPQGVDSFESRRAGVGCAPSPWRAPWGARRCSGDWQGLR